MFYKIEPCSEGLKYLVAKKIAVLRILSENCSPEMLRNIVQENPFLLNGVSVPESSAYHFAGLQNTTVELINYILVRHIDVDYDQTQSLLEMVFKYFNNDFLYDTVKLFISCGVDFNIRNKFNATPTHLLCRRINDSSVLEILRLVLNHGKNAIATLDNTPNESILDVAIWHSKSFWDKLNAVKLLLKFGAKPFKKTLKNCVRILYKETYLAMKLVKLVLQYLLINHDEIFTSFNIHAVNLFFSLIDYDKLLYESFIFTTTSYKVIEYKDIWIKELINYKNTLIRELVNMSDDKIDDNTTMFSFLYDQCQNGYIYCENEALLSIVLTKLRSSCYVCCYDLVYASIDLTAVLPLLYNLNISVKNVPNDTVIKLNSDTIMHLASYLSKEDVINLALAFWDVPGKKN